MAVLVQALVNADAAGIAFTADPITGDDSRILIDAAWGLGASVADGDVEPDHWEMDRQTHAIVTQRTGHKPTRCGPTPESPRESVLPEQQDAPCLTALQAAAVAALALRAEEIIGGPADVEWALQGDTLWLLQARPITTGVAGAADVPGITTAAGRPIPDGKDAAQRDESAAEPLKPVGPSPAFPFVWADPMDASTHWVQRAMDGRAPEAMPPLELDIRARFARSLGNARQIAGWRNAAERLMELNGWQYWTHDRPPTPAGVPAPDPFQHARETFTWLGEQLTERGENYRDAVVFPEMHARNKKLADVAPDILAPAELVAHLCDALRHYERGWTLHWCHPPASPQARFTRLVKEIMGYKTEDEARVAARELLGHEPNKLTDAVEGLVALARLANRHLPLRAWLMDHSPEQVDLDSLAGPAAPDGGAAFREALAAFLEPGRQGFRCGASWGVEQNQCLPGWRESPEIVIELVKRYLPLDHDALDRAREMAIADRDRKTDAVRVRIADNAQREQFEFWLAAGRRAVRAQEDHNYFIDSATNALLHRAISAAGRRLVSA